MTQTSPLGQTTQDISKRLVVEDSVEVKAPIQQVYNRWNDFTQFPSFMSNVEEVRPLTGNRYHWVARIFGIKQEWDAEVTERDPERRISWRSTSGAYNAGTVGFSPIGADKTEVRVRFEYTPPAGEVGKAFDALTKATHHEVKQDLKSFKKLLEGKKAVPAVQAEEVYQGREIGNVLGALTIPIATGVAGGLLAYSLYPKERQVSLTRPSTWMGVPAMTAARMNLGAVQTPWTSAKPINTTATVASWIAAGACAASILTSATLRLANRRKDALFVGQWAPTLLGLSVLSRLSGSPTARRDITTTTLSWGLFSAGLGSILASAFHHMAGKRNDGLFVGQWAPTFLTGAMLVRLFNKWF